MTKDTFNNINQLIESNRLSKAAEQLRILIEQERAFLIAEPLNKSIQEYEMMLEYMGKGYDDPGRKQVQEKVAETLTRTLHNISIITERRENPVFTQYQKQIEATPLSAETITEQLENYVVSLTMAQLDSSISLDRLRRQHHDFLSLVFAYLATSQMWTRHESDDITVLLLSPTINIEDAMIMVTAITLSCTHHFDKEKWMTLKNVYEGTNDEALRQRAFVGWIISLHNAPESEDLRDAVNSLCANEQTQQEMLKMQMEMIHCANAEADNKKMSEEIMPGLMKNINMKFDGKTLTENEDDELERIIHPELDDQRQEEMQHYFDKITEMQNNGADIYYHGLSMMKRYAFFYNPANWFCMFDIEHPDIQNVKGLDKSKKIITLMTSGSQLCDSDKYSLAIGLAGSMDIIPQDMQKAISEGTPMEDLERLKGMETNHRLSYLRDMYRFHMLSSYKVFYNNPFTWLPLCNKLIVDSPIKERIIELLPMLWRNKFRKQHDEFIRSYAVSITEDTNMTLYLANNYRQKHLYNKALAYYKVLYDRFSTSKSDANDDTHAEKYRRIIRGYALSLYGAHSYNEARGMLQSINELEPTDMSIRLKWIHCMIETGKTEDVINELFRLEYESGEGTSEAEFYDKDIKRLLAHALMATGRYPDAIKRYESLTKDKSNPKKDFAEYGIALWYDGQMDMAYTILNEWCVDLVKSSGLTYEKALDLLKSKQSKSISLYRKFTLEDLDLLCEWLWIKQSKE